MTSNTQQLARLNRIIVLAQKLIADNKKSQGGKLNGARKKRTRRTGKELVQFRKMLKAERKKGVPAAVLARKHGISSAYIYTLP